MVDKTNAFQSSLNSLIHSDFNGLSTRPSVLKMLKEHHILKEPFGVITLRQIDATTDCLKDEFCKNIHRVKTWVIKQCNYKSLWQFSLSSKQAGEKISKQYLQLVFDIQMILFAD